MSWRTRHCPMYTGLWELSPISRTIWLVVWVIAFSGLVPRWRLFQEGPFFAERSSSLLLCFGVGCAFRNTTYRPSDYASPSGEFGIPLHHPRFLEWIGVPELAGLLEMGPGRWLHSLTRDQAMDAAIQQHWDVCLMATNRDVMDQYAVSLQGTASKMLELGLDSRVFPRQKSLWVHWDPESAALPCRWRQWVWGVPYWIRLWCFKTLGCVWPTVSWNKFVLIMKLYGLWTQLAGLLYVVWFGRLYIL